MLINDVKLENFKIYDQFTFQFTKGANAICGPNGSGKSSVIEAIGWALFDYSPYKNVDQFIKNTKSDNGKPASASKVARVEITFVSDLDQKDYTVVRTTRGEYFVVDTETSERVMEKKREVLPFLKKHYNLLPQTELKELFVNTIGVPQGTFTSIFLDSNTNRKGVFDKLLNLEDYRVVFEKLRDFKKYLNDTQSDNSIKIATFKSDIEKIPFLEKEIKESTELTTRLEKEIDGQKLDRYNLKSELDLLDKMKIKLDALKVTLEKLNLSLKHTNDNEAKIKEDLAKSKEASEKILDLQESYETYKIKKEAFLKLEKKKLETDSLQKKEHSLEKELNSIAVLIAKNQEKLEEFDSVEKEISELEEAAQHERLLQAKQKDLADKKDTYQEYKTNISYLSKEKDIIENHLKVIDKELIDVEKLKVVLQDFEQLNIDNQNLKEVINKRESELSESKKMSCQVKGGLCPFLKQKCKNIEDGEDLESYFTNKIKDLLVKIQAEKLLYNNLQQSLKDAMNAKEQHDQLIMKETEKTNLLAKLNNILLNINSTESLLLELTSIPDDLRKVIDDIKKLGSPVSKIAYLRDKLKTRESVKTSLKLATSNHSLKEKEIQTLKEKMSVIDYNHDEYLEMQKLIQLLEPKYHEYLKLESLAKSFLHHELQFKSILEKKADIIADIDKITEEISVLSSQYDEVKHSDIKSSYNNLQILVAKKEEQYSLNKTLLMKKQVELKELFDLKKEVEKHIVESEKLEKILSFVDNSREIYRDCAPLIAKYYVESISNEANIIYQEITNKTNQELSWTCEYDIQVEEQGNPRSFSNLSGGEQMSAALAVRLALLKELSDVNIAFFDEPTTNMDETRRINLSNQIKTIKCFDQLFVISHDDTFEKDTDNVIRL